MQNADPPFWPLVVVSIMLLGLGIALWLQTKNPINWDRRHDDPE
ncbi:hypothetical protein [EBPR siphovirus 2]|nr:hypothetical protein [EBPR siphovirus 2]